MEFQSEFVGGGAEFFVRGWEPEGAPRAVAALIHGLGEHTGRYAHVGGAFTEAGLGLMAFDLRGHGRSSGRRGDAPDYETLMSDIDGFLGQVAARYPGVPLFLYGHSLGGNLVLNYALRRKPDLVGVVASSPWLRLAFEPPAFRLALGRVIYRVFPSFTQSAGLGADDLSRDPEVRTAATSDPFNHSKITVRYYFDFQNSGQWALDHATDFVLPLLVMHGTADRITSLEASREFVRQAGKRATFRTWEGCYHELHNDLRRSEVIEAVIEWIDARLAESPVGGIGLPGDGGRG